MSLKLPPTKDIFFDVSVIKVFLPLCEEQPNNPNIFNQLGPRFLQNSKDFFQFYIKKDLYGHESNVLLGSYS